MTSEVVCIIERRRCLNGNGLLEERELIMWALDYINARASTRNDQFYIDILDEIALGPDSSRAIS